MIQLNDRAIVPDNLMESSMTQVLDPDDDFADLDAEIATAMAAKAETNVLSTKKRRLASLASSKNKEAQYEHDCLLAEIRRMEDGIVWHTVSATALFHVQTCLMCDSRHRFFIGWMAEQHHKTDATARRFLKGKPVEDLPERIEEHNQGTVEMCSDCAESILIINAATKTHLGCGPAGSQNEPSA